MSTASRPTRILVVDDLVGNAIRCTPEDGHVTLGLEADGPGVAISVRDDGSGLDLGQAERAAVAGWATSIVA